MPPAFMWSNTTNAFDLFYDLQYPSMSILNVTILGLTASLLIPPNNFLAFVIFFCLQRPAFVIFFWLQRPPVYALYVTTLNKLHSHPSRRAHWMRDQRGTRSISFGIRPISSILTNNLFASTRSPFCQNRSIRVVNMATLGDSQLSSTGKQLRNRSEHSRIEEA